MREYRRGIGIIISLLHVQISMQNFKSRFRGKSTLSNEDLLLLMHHSEVPVINSS